MIPRSDLFAVVLDLAQVLQAAAIYPEHHGRVHDLLSRLHERIRRITAANDTLHIGAIADHFVVDVHPFIDMNPALRKLLDGIRGKGMEKISFREGLTPGELKRFVYFLATGKEDALGQRFENIQCGLLETLDSGKSAPAVLAGVLPRTHVLYGAADVLAVLLKSLAGIGESAPSVRDGRDIVASVMKGLRQDASLIQRLLALQAHDDYTVTHSLNVCAIVTAQAMRLGLPEDRVRDFGLAALFHDVGKELVPSGILRKPGRIDAEEFARMAEHPVLGATILRRIDFGTDLPVIVCFEHHMKSDLTGYPKADRVGRPHPVSLMTQIADVYDALRTHRPYRSGLDPGTTLSIMKEGCGTEFDATLFGNFLCTLPPDQRPAGT